MTLWVSLWLRKPASYEIFFDSDAGVWNSRCLKIEVFARLDEIEEIEGLPTQLRPLDLPLHGTSWNPFGCPDLRGVLITQIFGDLMNSIEKHVAENRWFPKTGVHQNGWFIVENPIRMNDLGVPPFQEIQMWIYMTLVYMDIDQIHYIHQQTSAFRIFKIYSILHIIISENMAFTWHFSSESLWIRPLHLCGDHRWQGSRRSLALRV